jgi:futalosine hydrolase
MKQNTNRSTRILLTAATATEAVVVQEILGQEIGPKTPVGTIVPGQSNHFDLLITGVGIAASTHHLTRALHAGNHQRVIQVGVAGAYRPDWPVGSVVQVTRDRFSDFGAEHGDHWLPAEKLPFTGADSFPFVNGWLEPPATEAYPPLLLHRAVGITSDTVHTTPDSIQRITSLYQPDLETMEGAALFFVCMWMDIPCLQIRALSNPVGPRTPENWNLDLALQNLRSLLIPYLRSL